MSEAITSRSQMESVIKIWQWSIFILGLGLVATYAVYFSWVLEQSPAQDAEKWGQFGDFVGGLLNPIVAFAAFYWLTQSVKIQKQELADTRDELAKATRNSTASLEISVLSTLISAEEARGEKLKWHVEKHLELMKSPSSALFPSDNLINELRDFRKQENESEKNLDIYRKRLEKILTEQSIS